MNNVYVSSVNHDFDPGRVRRKRAARADRAVPPGRPHRLRHASDRHARRSRDRSGLGTVPAGPSADRRRLDAAGVGREDPAVPGRSRRGAQGEAIHGRAAFAADRQQTGVDQESGAACCPGWRTDRAAPPVVRHVRSRIGFAADERG